MVNYLGPLNSSKSIFPFAQVTYLSEHSSNFLKGALAVLFQDAIRVPGAVWTTISFLFPQIED